MLCVCVYYIYIFVCNYRIQEEEIMDIRSWEDIGTNCFVGVKNGATIVLMNEIIKNILNQILEIYKGYILID